MGRDQSSDLDDQASHRQGCRVFLRCKIRVPLRLRGCFAQVFICKFQLVDMDGFQTLKISLLGSQKMTDKTPATRLYFDVRGRTPAALPSHPGLIAGFVSDDNL